jgi:Iodothyronine deiodinase
MCRSRRPGPARKSRPRAVLSVAMPSLGVIAAFVLVGCTCPYDGPQSAAGPEQGPGDAGPPELPQVGAMAPDFTLRDLEGGQVRLSDYRGRMPVLIEFGSLSCPIVRGRTGHLDMLAQDYQGKAQFWFVYGNETHPGHGEMRSASYGTFQALPQVRDYDDRCEHARLFRNTVKTNRRILVDEDGADSVAARYGIRGIGIVIVDIGGRICWAGAATGNLPDLDDVLGSPPTPRPGALTPAADACLAQPFDLDDLLTRLHALVRRA